MNSTKKKTLLNLTMVLAIIAIFVVAVLSVGNLQGWFDKPEDEQTVFTSSAKTGSVNIEREGISYSLKNGVQIRDGDRIETLNASAVTLLLGETNCVKLGDNTRVNINLQTQLPGKSATNPVEENTKASTYPQMNVIFELVQGEAFVDMSAEGGFCTLRMDAEDVSCKNGVFYFSSQTGAKTIYVLSGTVEANGKTANSGQSITLLTGDSSLTTLVSELSPQGMNAFVISCAKTANEHIELCFTNSELDAITDAREQERQQAHQQALIDSSDTKKHCTIEIRCDTILDHMDWLAEGKNAFVPANGIILATSQIQFAEGETVFDVLKRACSLTGIQLEYSWTPMYGSCYIESINNLYEFDCGEPGNNLSGWMYKVNGWFPNYGSSSYTLSEGDAIVWCYTCRGLGEDIDCYSME